MRREDLPSLSPRALGEDEQRRLLRAVERQASSRDAGIVMLGLFCGVAPVGAGRSRRGGCGALRPQRTGDDQKRQG